jgi:cell fate (sporulation/competence/biofilm development) regulator YmcA (YheA/YmcA/DUF963 family)
MIKDVRRVDLTIPIIGSSVNSYSKAAYKASDVLQSITTILVDKVSCSDF